MFTSVGTGSAQTANVTTQRDVDQHQDVFSVHDRGAIKHVKRDPLGLENCIPAARDRTYEGLTRDLRLERVPHMPNLALPALDETASAVF